MVHRKYFSFYGLQIVKEKLKNDLDYDNQRPSVPTMNKKVKLFHQFFYIFDSTTNQVLSIIY